MGEDACPSCGTPVPEGAPRCPSCGLPRRPTGPRRASGRTTIAGFLLLSLFALTLFQGIFTVMDPGKALSPATSLGGREVTVTGHVIEENGFDVANATLSWRDVRSTTNASGAFSLGPLPIGYVVVRVEAAGFRPTEVRFVLTADRDATIRLEPGTAGRTVSDASYSRVVGFMNACGFTLIGISVLLILGALAAYRRRNYALALWSGILGLFGSIPVSLILGLLVILLVRKSRDEFR